jgi:hypothetical protein
MILAGCYDHNEICITSFLVTIILGSYNYSSSFEYVGSYSRDNIRPVITKNKNRFSFLCLMQC